MNVLRPDWPAPPNVLAAMTLREGGVSTGSFASLNLGAGIDDPAHVGENRRRLREALQLPAEPHWLKQVHGTTVVAAGESALEADACFASRPGRVCVAQAADCLPVLFCDDGGSAVAAAHAGWRGLAAGVLEATVRSLPAAPPTLMAWLGAAIGPESFEVGEDVRAAFMEVQPQAAAAFAPGRAPGKYFADLYALARMRLARAGVTRVYGGGLDTLRDARRFFSFRRDGRCGRMAALVWRTR